MIGFKEFLAEATIQYKGMSGESKSANALAAKLKTEASEAIGQIAKGNILYRGVKLAEKDADFTYKYGKEIQRKSIQKYGEHYTDILDALPSWKDLNKIANRTTSAIATSDIVKAKEYTDDHRPYILIPANGTQLIACSDSDIKTSFMQLQNFGAKDGSLNITTQSLSQNLGPLLKLALGDSAPKKENFISSLKKMTVEVFDEGNNKWTNAQVSAYKPYHNMLVKTHTDNLFDALNIAMDPDQNGFEELALTAKYPRQTEIWFSANFGSVRMQHEETPELLEFCKITKLDVKHFLL